MAKRQLLYSGNGNNTYRVTSTVRAWIGRKTIIVSYCFKSARGMSETLEALGLLKRSLPTQRTLNHS